MTKINTPEGSHAISIFVFDFNTLPTPTPTHPHQPQIITDHFLWEYYSGRACIVTDYHKNIVTRQTINRTMSYANICADHNYTCAVHVSSFLPHYISYLLAVCPMHATCVWRWGPSSTVNITSASTVGLLHDLSLLNGDNCLLIGPEIGINCQLMANYWNRLSVFGNSQNNKGRRPCCCFLAVIIILCIIGRRTLWFIDSM